jgi:hypothetical protein
MPCSLHPTRTPINVNAYLCGEWSCRNAGTPAAANLCGALADGGDQKIAGAARSSIPRALTSSSSILPAPRDLLARGQVRRAYLPRTSVGSTWMHHESLCFARGSKRNPADSYTCMEVEKNATATSSRNSDAKSGHSARDACLS